MQVTTAIKCITLALAAITALHAPQVHGEEMAYYSKNAAPVVSSYGKAIRPARVKMMQKQQKRFGHSPYAKAAGVDLAAISAPVAPSSGEIISPECVKVMQDEMKLVDHSVYAKEVGVDLSQLGSSAVPVVTPALAPTPAPVSPPTPIAADASLDPVRVEIIKMELKELGFSPHAEVNGIDLKKAGFVVPDRAAPRGASASATTTTSASDPSGTTAAAGSDVVQTGAGY